jgi:dihydroneopterin aldolase/2-amino-4-hydroxy-6-hydroxymethyldihydropteridine diphosphokinase
MARAFIAIASNIDPEENIREGLRELARRLRIRGTSTFYRSEPLGRPEQPPFINGVVEIDTDLPPRQLKYGVLRAVESEMGRIRTADKYAPRTLDLDLLLYEDRMEFSPELTLPDPEITARPFLAVPLAELAPELALPGDGRPLQDIADQFVNSGMERLTAYTEELRRELGNGSRQSEAPRQRAAYRDRGRP